MVSMGFGGMVVLDAMRKGLQDKALSFTFMSTPYSYAQLIADRREKVWPNLLYSYFYATSIFRCFYILRFVYDSKGC